MYFVEDHSEEKRNEYREMAQLVLLNLARMISKSAPQKRLEPREPREQNLPFLPSTEDIVKVFCVVNCNVFTITNEENTPVGIGLFPQGALLNHSCDPNCVVSFQNQQMIIRTIQNVSQGEELTVRKTN